MGCSLVVLACNTASAKALRSIQQHDLPKLQQVKRVLGVIRPTTEEIGKFTKTGHVGILATTGTVSSQSYVLEIGKFYPELAVYQQDCPMWVPLVENNEHCGEGADYFVRKDVDKLLSRSPLIDTIILGCTHYPLLIEKIRNYISPGTTLISQGPVVAMKLADYLIRHPEIRERCSTGGTREFYTTESPSVFDVKAELFYGQPVVSKHLAL
jgi:glutamate racemase